MGGGRVKVASMTGEGSGSDPAAIFDITKEVETSLKRTVGTLDDGNHLPSGRANIFHHVNRIS